MMIQRSGAWPPHEPEIGPGVTSPSWRARSSNALTEEACHFRPPRGGRSCIRSNCWPISSSVRSGSAMAMPATRVISRSSGGRFGDRFIKDASAMRSRTRRCTPAPQALTWADSRRLFTVMQCVRKGSFAGVFYRSICSLVQRDGGGVWCIDTGEPTKRARGPAWPKRGNCGV